MRISANTLPCIMDYAQHGRVVVFDTETTGCTGDDEICQLAAAEYVNGERTRTMSVYICPTCEMNPFAEAVHGLSMDFLAEHGGTAEEGMSQFFEFLGDNVLLVAHNITFDLRMVQTMCRKFDLAFEAESIETCDTIALAKNLAPGLPSYKLCNLLSALDIEGCNSHDALDDVLACAGLFFKLLTSCS